MNYILEFELPGLPAMMNASGRSRHWRTVAREKRRWRQTTALVVRSRRPPQPLAKAKLSCTRFSSNEPDFDGLVSGFKPIIDGLKDAGILVDDKSANIGQPSYTWEHAPNGQGKVRIRIEEVNLSLSVSPSN